MGSERVGHDWATYKACKHSKGKNIGKNQVDQQLVLIQNEEMPLCQKSTSGPWIPVVLQLSGLSNSFLYTLDGAKIFENTRSMEVPCLHLWAVKQNVLKVMYQKPMSWSAWEALVPSQSRREVELHYDGIIKSKRHERRILQSLRQKMQSSWVEVFTR